LILSANKICLVLLKNFPGIPWLRSMICVHDTLWIIHYAPNSRFTLRYW
jgi:hypothetical protein